MPTPEQQRQYQELVEAIVQAVPDIEQDYRAICEGCGVIRKFLRNPCLKCGEAKFRDEYDFRPITLEDVLQTFFEKPIEGQPDWDNAMILIVNKWKFGKSLAEQDESCWKFLHGLLCKE